jgi:FtsP/CotA-like multicopper oxidase with cupredoxin domain
MSSAALRPWLLAAAFLVPLSCSSRSQESANLGESALRNAASIVEFEDINPDPNVVEVNLTAAPASLELTPGHQTDVLAFNGSIPGPLLRARVGDRVIVHFKNGLAEPTTVHWHGLRIPSAMDGTPRVQSPIPPGGTFDYDFVVPDAGTYWYHPHLNTIEQIDRGLYGPIVIEERDPPRFTAERVFVLDDVRLDANYQMAPYGGMMDMMMGRFGNKLLVNGHTDPVTGNVKHGGVERWRLINAAGARIMEMGIEGASFRVVGTDGGFLPTPYTADRVSLAVGQRFDLEVTFDRDETTESRLAAHVPMRGPDGGVVEGTVPLATLAFDGLTIGERPTYPAVTLPELASDPRQKEFRLGMTEDASGHMMMTINGQDGMTLPIEEYTQNQPVRFTIVNEDTMHFHPFHVHGNFFQIVTRNGQPANEPGFKDVVLVNPSEKVEIETRFQNPGDWMVHCHIAEHAEQGMMTQLRVLPTP